MEDYWMGKVDRTDLSALMRLQLPEVRDMSMPAEAFSST